VLAPPTLAVFSLKPPTVSFTNAEPLDGVLHDTTLTLRGGAAVARRARQAQARSTGMACATAAP
jgi:hypothetical protein